MTVQELRNKGYKVRVLHHRYCDGYYTRRGHGADAKGGATQIIIDSPTGENYQGLAICSEKDNYNKKLGVKIALGRCGFYG